MRARGGVVLERAICILHTCRGHIIEEKVEIRREVSWLCDYSSAQFVYSRNEEIDVVVVTVIRSSIIGGVLMSLAFFARYKRVYIKVSLRVGCVTSPKCESFFFDNNRARTQFQIAVRSPDSWNM